MIRICIFLTPSLKVESLFDAQSTCSRVIPIIRKINKFCNFLIYFGWNPRTENTIKGVSLQILKDGFKKGKEQSFLQMHDRKDGNQSVSVVPRIIWGKHQEKFPSLFPLGKTSCVSYKISLSASCFLKKQVK